MNVLILNQSEIRALLPMRECIQVMEEALRALALGQAVQPLRPLMWLPDRRGVLGLMPSHLQTLQRMGVKAITVFPGNHGTPYESHQGVVLLFEAQHGSLLAILDAAEITAIRTAAVSGLATRLLAREEAAELAILGSGVQARTHLEAMLCVRPISRVRLWSRNQEHARAFAREAEERLEIPLLVTPQAEEAVRGADIICTVTASPEPVLRGDWVQPGAHINAVGSSTPRARELDTQAVLRSRFYVDSLESALHEAGDFLIPRQEGVLDEKHIVGEIGQILAGRLPARRDPREVTIFKSLGLGVEDLAAAHHVYEAARQRGMGHSVWLGGVPHA